MLDRVRSRARPGNRIASPTPNWHQDQTLAHDDRPDNQPTASTEALI
ncbi:MAG: hypothetical protein ACRYGK_12755 [Janthinobacterium lividum]